MKYLLIAALAAIAVQDASAATLSSLKLVYKVSANQVCNTATCSMPTKASANLDATIDLTPAEIAKIDLQTRFQIILTNDVGVKADFLLAGVPGYTAGDTSVNVQVENDDLTGVHVIQNITLDWSSGSMQIKLTSKAAGVIESTQTVQALGVRLGPDRDKAVEKAEPGYQNTILFKAETSSGIIYSITAKLKDTINQSEKKISNPDGSGSDKIKATISGDDFELPV